MPSAQVIAAPKARSPFIAKGGKADAASLAQKDAALIAAFHRKGFRDVVLKDRNNPNADFNVKPFKLWVAEGRIVRKGQKSVHGLFHRDQTDPIPTKASPISTEQKQLFAKAKAALKAKKAKLQPVT
jgi:hypothetical protein